MSSVPRLPPAMDCDTIDQAQRTQLPSEVVQPAGTDSVPQQASTQPGDGTEVHTRKQPEPNIVEVPSDHSQKSPKVPFKEQVVGVAKV
ncbi:hypothetical protein L208DRAFT_1415583 [Tricholoma matsutake]|nr:hypothetical protein L208DRAFT_1415583 [Tricholoma matsutake 945]